PHHTGRPSPACERFPMDPLKYLVGYPPHVLARVQALIEQGQLGKVLEDRHLRKAVPLGKVRYDSKLQVMKHALGTHTTISRVQGDRLKTSREIRIATVFRDAPADFLKMIVVHELAHLKEAEHNKSFYQLCTHMESDYHQLEFDLRLYLTHLDAEQR